MKVEFEDELILLDKKLIYVENFWTNKRTIYLGKEKLIEKDNNEFITKRTDFGIPHKVKVIGNHFKGVKLLFDDEYEFVAYKPIKFYVYLLLLLPIIFVFFFSYVPVFKENGFIVKGSYIGVIISIICSALSLFTMIRTRKLYQQLIIILIYSTIAVLICLAFGFLL